MASMFIRHRVADYGKWKSVFDEHEGVRRAAGFTSHSLHKEPDDANVIIIAMCTTDVSRAKEFAASEDLKSTMAQAGVLAPPEIWFADDVEEKRY